MRDLYERFPTLAAELVALEPNVIGTDSTPAAKRATGQRRPA